MELKFFSIDEVKEFVANLKGTRTGKKGEGDEGGNPNIATTGGPNAPAPIMPQGGGQPFNPGGFALPAGGAVQPGGAFPAAGAQSGPAPEVLMLVQRIAARIDWATAPPPNGGGQPPESVLAWFRTQCGPETANYTLDQIKQVALPRAAQPTLENIAKLMNA